MPFGHAKTLMHKQSQNGYAVLAHFGSGLQPLPLIPLHYNPKLKYFGVAEWNVNVHREMATLWPLF